MHLSSALDTFLDRTIAPGYGNVGLAVRRRLPDWPADPPRLDGKVVLVTGAGAGLGLATAAGYARLGASVRALGRNEERAADAARRARELAGGDIRPVACDVSDIADVRRFVREFTESEERLDVLVNNAGVMPPEREETADGVELAFATMVLGPFMLIDGLQDLLRRSAPARVINVSSGGAYSQRIPDDLQTRDDYDPKTVYARAKRCQLVLTEQWAEKLDGTGVVVHSMHPGWADTEGVRTFMPTFRKITRPLLRSADAGADTIVWMGGAPEVGATTGLFWHDRRPRPTHYAIGASPDDDAARDRVWQHCAELAGAAVGTR